MGKIYNKYEREKINVYIIERKLLKSNTKKKDNPVGMGRQ